VSERNHIPGLSPEIEFWIKMESIFMPYARRHRDAALKNGIRFVHYTSAEAALSIIRSKRVWMRNAVCMADYREIQHGFDILSGFFSDKSKLDSFVSALDMRAPGVALKAMNLFYEWWKPGPHSIPLNTYIASISEHDDDEDFLGRLSMWRAFGGNATTRVAFVFKLPGFTEAGDALKVLFSPVAYLTEEQAQGVIAEVVRNIGQNCDFLKSVDSQIVLNTVFNMLLAGVTCLKHRGFHEEREWRAIYSPKLRPSDLMESSTEVVSGVPQRVYKLPLDEKASPTLVDLDLSRLFDRLIIGPSPYPWPIYDSFTTELEKAGVKDSHDRVWISNIPIRY